MRDIVITSSILILAVLLIRQMTKGRLAPILQYALWLPVVVRLLLPIPLWSSSFSVLNLIPEGGRSAGIGEEAEEYSEWPVVDKAETDIGKRVEAGKEEPETGKEAPKAEETAPKAEETEPEAGKDPETDVPETGNTGNGMIAVNENTARADIAGNAVGTDPVGNIQSGRESFFVQAGKALPCIWAAGMLLAGGYMFFYQMKWCRYLRANRIPLTGREKYRGLSVYTVEGLPSPCLTGRCIYLTEEMAGEPKRLAHILAHEYCHYKQLDSLWVIVRCVLMAVYWFHPLVLAAARVSKQDSELACDAAAIRLLGEEERLAYGKTLLCLIAGNDHNRKCIGLASTMSGGEKGIKERISRIAGKPQYMMATAGVVLLLIAAAIAATFSGTAKMQRQDGRTEGDANLPVLAEAADGQSAGMAGAQGVESAGGQGVELDGVQSAGLQQELEERLAEEQKMLEAIDEEKKVLEEKMAEEQKMLEVLNEEKKALEEETADAAREQAVLKMLSSYDSDIDVLGSREDVFGVAGALNLSDYVQAYYESGEMALEEGMYLLETHKGTDGSDIKIYGMYSKKYGCEGIKILIGDDASDFDEKWLPSYMHGMEENLRVYESAENGMPRTFACTMVVENTSDREFWNLYMGDRYDTGMTELYIVRPEELLGQIREQVSFEIVAEESRIDVYHNGEKSDSITVDASAEAMRSIEEVIVYDGAASWKLGGGEDEIRLLLPIGLKLKTTDDIWYDGLPLLSISVSCGSFGDRKIEIGQVSADTAYVHQKGLSQGTLEQYLETAGENSRDASTDILAGLSADGAHYDVEIQYGNPCPSYTRISDTFGVRTNPATGKKRAHNGIDFAAEKGADVLAAADGSVYRTGFDSDNGNYVILYHVMSGEYTYYTHCQEILVAEGNSVTAGQKIATVGNTGRSTGPHLHFALSRGGEYVEPVWE